MDMLNKAKATASTAVEAASTAASAAIAAVTPEPLPPPRDKWTQGLLESCGEDFGYGLYACICPLCTTPELRAYRKTGNLDAKPDNIMMEMCCFYFMGDGLLANERTQMHALCPAPNAKTVAIERAHPPELLPSTSPLTPSR